MFTEHMNKLYAGSQTMHAGAQTMYAGAQTMQVSTFAPGDVVVASSDDQSWYRAQVISYAQGDDCVLLCYLDYGDCHRIGTHMIRPLLCVDGRALVPLLSLVSLFQATAYGLPCVHCSLLSC